MLLNFSVNTFNLKTNKIREETVLWQRAGRNAIQWTESTLQPSAFHSTLQGTFRILNGYLEEQLKYTFYLTRLLYIFKFERTLWDYLKL